MIGGVAVKSHAGTTLFATLLFDENAHLCGTNAAAESCLCYLLPWGLSLQEAADAASIGISTARSHLKSIFRKCRVTSQSQLMLRLVQSRTATGA